MKKILIVLGVVVVSAGFYACTKDNSETSGTTNLKVMLTDAPYNAQEINVDIREVKVNYTGDTLGWITVPTTAGIYNLLDFQNGIDTVLAAGPVPTGVLNEIRFVLGSNNTIMIDSTVYPITIPSGSESGLKVKLHNAISGPLDSLTIDFDAGASIHQTGQGNYIMRPVLQVK